MKKMLLIALIFSVNLNAQTYKKTYGESATDNVTDMTNTKDGGQILTGDTYSFGVSQSDMYFVKTDAAGNVQWSKTFGTAGYDYSSGIIQTRDGGYAVSGTSNSRMTLLKLDADGNTQWVKYFTANNRQGGSALVQTPDGGYAVAGQVSTNNNGSWGYLVRTDSTGSLLWSKLIFSRNFYPEIIDMTLTADGGFALAAIFPTPAYYDMYLIKLSADGDFQWARSIGGESTELPSFVKQTSDGGFLVGGMSFSYGDIIGQDMFVFKTTSNGTLQWAKNIGTTKSESFSDAFEVPGGFVVVGSTDSSTSFFRRPTLVRIKNNGTIQGVRILTEADDAGISSASAYTSDGFSIAGSYSSFYGGTQEMLVIKFDKRGLTCGDFTSFGSVKDTGLLVVQNIPVTNASTSVSSGSEPTVSRKSIVTDLCKKMVMESALSLTEALPGTSKMQLHIAPNPVAGVLRLYWNSKSNNDLSINILSADGRIMLTRKFHANEGGNMYSIPVNNLTRGIYILNVMDRSGKQALKFVKQ